MKKILSLALVLSCIFSCKEKDLPELLMDMNEGLEVVHSKTEVFAEYNDNTSGDEEKYIWRYETSVSTDLPGLKITEFGVYFWNTKGEWEFKTIYNRPFNAEEFSEWYGCPDAILTPGTKFTDGNNWSKGDELGGKSARTMWYFIADNEEGERFYGAKEILTVFQME